MKYKPELKKMSDDDLLRRLSELLQDSRRVEADLVVHMAEVDERRLYQMTSSSMFKYATEVLYLSEAEAYLRIEAARASRKHPVLLDMLADGRLHLSGIAVLAPILTEANRETVLARATHKTKAQIKELVAEIAPKPDVPSSIRKLPERPKKPNPALALKPELRPDAVHFETSTPTTQTSPSTSPVVEPIAEARYKVAFTASAAFRDKLERLKALMRSSVPDGDLAAILEEAVTEKLEKLEAKRYGKTKNPRKTLEETDTSASSRYLPAPVRRAVYERDEGQCAYRNPTGRRCTESRRLEFHHIEPYGRRGDHRPENIELRCRTHNVLDAERDYGKEAMDKYRKSGGQVSEPATVYFTNNLRADRATPSSLSP
jgi:hypothetical protein